MILELQFDRSRPRLWMERAISAFSKDNVVVQVAWIDADAPKPQALDALFELERMLLKRGARDGSDSVSIDAVGGMSMKGEPDIVVDFSSGAAGRKTTAARRIVPLYNGATGENGLLEATLAGDLPRIDILDENQGRIISSGYPSAEAAKGLSGALDTVMARTMTLLASVLAGGSTVDQGRNARSMTSDRRSPVPYVLSTLGRAFAREIYRLCCYSPHWRVGWRMTDDEGVWARGDLSGPAWNVVPDPGVRFYADPFPVTWQGRTFVFVEELDHRVGKGFISAIEFDENGPKGSAQPAIEEQWHLSYPFLMEHDGALWMVPESIGHSDVALYRCIDFPNRWERSATLLSNIQLSDATITEHNGRYYLFGALWDGGGGYSDTLAIYHSASLFGPWQPHANNPVLVDRSGARPGGSFVRRGGSLWRPIQDCSEGYGSGMALAEVVDLSPDSFQQVVRHTLKPGPLWPGRKLHTLNRSGRLEVIDGTAIQPKLTAGLFAK
jgi:hypothetical protein